MANNSTNPELYALGKMLDMYLMQPQMYQPVTGIGNGRGDILDGIQAGMNLKRNWLNRGIQKNINNDILQEREKIRALNPFGGNNNEGTQQQVVQQQAVPQQQYLITQQPPQRDVYSVGSPVISVGEAPQQPGFGSVLKTDNPYPFGVSVNSETPSSTENNVSGVEQRLQPQVQVGIPQQQQISSFQQALQALPSAKYLGDEYRTDNYIRNLQGQGYGAVIGRLADLAFMNPLRESAKADRTQEALRQYLTSPDPQVRQDAMTQLSIDYNNPTLADDIQRKKDAAQLARDRLLIEAGFMPEWMEPYAGGGMEGEEGGSQSNNYAGVNFEGKSWIRNNDGVDLSNAQQNTITGLNHISDIFQKMTGKPLIVTSGNDGNIHASGEFSHGNGWKVDVSGNGLEDPETRHAFIKQCESLGIKVLDEYEHPSPNSTGGHLDLQFSGYKGSRPSQNRWGALRLTPKELARRAKNQAEMDYKRALLGLRAEDNAIKRERIAARNGANGRGIIKREDGSEIALPKLKDMKNEDIYKTIQEYSDKDLDELTEDKAQIYKVGDAFAKQFQSYVVRFNGDEKQAIRQMAYELQGNNKKGYSMNLDKLGLAIGAAYVSGLGIKDDPARGINTNEVIYNVANYVKNFIEENDNGDGKKTVEGNSTPSNPNSKEAKYQKHAATVKPMTLEGTREHQNEQKNKFSAIAKYNPNYGEDDIYSAMAKYNS